MCSRREVSVVRDEPSVRIDVFRYRDYREFLRDFYLKKKAQRAGFSFRGFSKRAKLGSPNYLKLVMDGARNLTPEMAARFATACGLEGESHAYFCELVAFNQSEGANQKAHYERLLAFERYRRAHRIDVAHAALHAAWYIPAIRELVARADFREDAAWIARMMRPAISESEAERAIATLLALQLLVRGEDGKLAWGTEVITTGPETRGVHIATYHRAMMARAAESLDSIPAGERDISSLTLCLGAAGLREVKERIQRFRRELVELATNEPDPKQVVQVNFQLFPLSEAGNGPAQGPVRRGRKA